MVQQINLSANSQLDVGSRTTNAASSFKASENSQVQSDAQKKIRDPETKQDTTLDVMASNLRALGAVSLNITIDQNSREPVIKIMNRETGEEILQIPAEHSLQISKTAKILAGMIFDLKA